MSKYVCKICGYVHEGDSAPDKCPVCGAPAEKFEEMTDMTWAAEHVVGVAKDAPEDIKEAPDRFRKVQQQVPVFRHLVDHVKKALPLCGPDLLELCKSASGTDDIQTVDALDTKLQT